MIEETNNLHGRINQYQTDEKLKKRIALHQRFSTNPQAWAEWVGEQLPLSQGGRTLELGCGSGELWLAQSGKLPQHLDLFLSDRSMGMLRSAEKNLSALKLPLFCCDALHIPLPVESIEVLIANHLIFHLPDIPAALREMHRVLKPGGSFCATTHGSQTMQELYDLTGSFSDLPLAEGTPDPQTGNQRFTLENGLPLLEDVFGSAEIRLYPAHLGVTEAQPLLDYIQSIWVVSGEVEKNMRETIAAEISRTGCFFIHKSQGMLIARKHV